MTEKDMKNDIEEDIKDMKRHRKGHTMAAKRTMREDAEMRMMKAKRRRGGLDGRAVEGCGRVCLRMCWL